MALSRIRINDLRCLSQVELGLDTRRNYIFGPNGAGKTSILEGMFMLGRGRSFRTRQTRRLVRRGSEGFAVYGEVPADGRVRRLGVSFATGQLEKKIDGAEAAGMAALAEVLPVHAIDPSIHELVEGGPSERRRFLDWGVFHVEHGYLEAWKRYRRVLSQRNAALKRHSDTGELRAWAAALIEAANAIDLSRRTYVECLRAEVESIGSLVLDQALSVSYRRGWSEGLSFEEALHAAEPQDRLAGTTEVGPHRADLVLHLDHRRVQDEASRGQQKLTAAALVVSQVALCSASATESNVLLVDDPAAELDGRSLGRLLEVLDALPAQLVFTGLSALQLAPDPGYPVFHVERGQLRAL